MGSFPRVVIVLGVVAAAGACAPGGAERVAEPEKVGQTRSAVGFAPTGSMVSGRGGVNYGAVRLADGRVLVAGAAQDQSWEIYDPTSGTFTTVPGLKYTWGYYGYCQGYCYPIGVVLPSGDVFWAGSLGMQIWRVGTATVGGFYLSADPNFGNLGRVPVLLTDGRVLLTGGMGEAKTPYPSTTTAGLFDPASATFELTGFMAERRVTHTATRLSDGRVLVVGGYSYEGGNRVAHASAEIYDPATRVFTLTGAMAQTRYGHGAYLLPSGKVLVAGGGVTVAELFDPATGTFSPTGSMAVASAVGSAQLLDGRVLFVHGDSAEIYDPATGLFAPTAPPTAKRSGHAATTLLTGEVLVTGGWPRSTLAELFDPTEPDAGASVDAGSILDGSADAGSLGAMDAGAADADAAPTDPASTRPSGASPATDPVAGDEAWSGAGSGCVAARRTSPPPLTPLASGLLIATLAATACRRRRQRSSHRFH